MIRYAVFLCTTLSAIAAEHNHFVSASFSHDRNRIAFGAHEYYVMLATMGNPHADTILGNPDSQNSITALTFTPDDTQMVAGTYKGAISLWNNNNTQRINSIKHKFNKAIKLIACINQSSIVATQADEKKAPKIIDLNTSKTRNKLMHKDTVQSLQPLDESTILLADCYANNIWDIRTDTIVKTIPNQTSMTRGIAYHKDTSCIALGKSTNEQAESVIELWDNRSTQQAGTIVHRGFLTRGIEKLAFSPDGDALGFIADTSLMIVKPNQPETTYRSTVIVTAAALALAGKDNSFLVAQENGKISEVTLPESA